jgi:hypothetical protein
MAYNREWDMGKEDWHEGGSWSGRGRDDDYGEGKKRKFNGGVLGPLLFLFLNTSPRSLQTWDDGGQDSQGYQDYGVGGGGFHGHKKRLVASDPSPHVIFLGLDTGFTESDVRAIVHRSPYWSITHDKQLHTFLTGQGCSIETVTIIRERSTGTCPSLESSWTIPLTIPFFLSPFSFSSYRLHRPIQGLRFRPIRFYRGRTRLRGPAVSLHSSSSSSLAWRICYRRVLQSSQNRWTAQRAPCQN